MTRSRHHRYLRGAAVAAAAALAAISCTRPGTPPGGGGNGPVTTMKPGGGMEHDHMPDRLNHPPTEQQKTDALAFVKATRDAVKKSGITLANIQSRGYINIGDGVHWVSPANHRDDYELNPDHIEAFAAMGGKLVAAMYVMKHGTTMDDVPDIAGDWTMWHDHVLSYKSNNINSDDYFRLGGPYRRQTVPMIHVWLQPNACGPFTGTSPGTGSCIRELANV